MWIVEWNRDILLDKNGSWQIEWIVKCRNFWSIVKQLLQILENLRQWFYFVIQLELMMVSIIHEHGHISRRFGGQIPLFFENQYGLDSKRYPKKGHDEKIFEKIGPPQKYWIHPCSWGWWYSGVPKNFWRVVF